MRRQFSKIDRRMMARPLGLQAVNPPRVFADRAGEMVAVRDLRFVQVTEINRAVGPSCQIHGTEPRIARGDGTSEVLCLERRSVPIDLAGDNSPLQRLDAKKLCRDRLGGKATSS